MMLIEIFPIEQDLGALEPGTPVSSQIAVSAVEATSTAMGGKTMTVLPLLPQGGREAKVERSL